MHRRLTFLTGFLGFTGVACGALGAHAVKRALLDLPDAALRIGWWEIGARYHLVHALATGLAAVLAAQVVGRFPRMAGGLFALGTLLFSGSLYVMALTGARGLGMVAPFGGAALMGGWLALALGARGLGHQKEEPRPGEP